jgi:ribose transport system substrate-binding protein
MRFQNTRTRFRGFVGVCSVVAAAGLVACGSSGSTASSTATTAGEAAPGLTTGPVYQAAAAASRAALRGTFMLPSAQSRPAAKGKSIVVLSGGQAVSSSAIPSDAAVAAARAMGWKVTLYDAKLNPANYTPLINQAVAAGADGIVLDAVDCDAAKEAMSQARKSGVALVAIDAFDCTDPHAGDAARGVYSAGINYGLPGGFAQLQSDEGIAEANYILASSHNDAPIVVFQDPEFVGLGYIDRAFVKKIDGSAGSTVLATVSFTTADLAGGKLAEIVQATMLRYPTATWVTSPYAAATEIGVVPGLGANPRHVQVVSQEATPEVETLIGQGKVTAVVDTDPTWVGWAAVDTMNSVFLGRPPSLSGLGLRIVDAGDLRPSPAGTTESTAFMSAYEKAWARP